MCWDDPFVCRRGSAVPSLLHIATRRGGREGLYRRGGPRVRVGSIKLLIVSSLRKYVYGSTFVLSYESTRVSGRLERSSCQSPVYRHQLYERLLSVLPPEDFRTCTRTVHL